MCFCTLWPEYKLDAAAKNYTLEKEVFFFIKSLKQEAIKNMKSKNLKNKSNM